MSEPIQSSTPKEAAEVERLKLEIEQMKRSAWRSPATIIALGGLLISLSANLHQFVASGRAEERARLELQLAQDRWEEEREKLRAEVKALQENQESRQIDRDTIRAELQQINEDIAVYDATIFKNNLDRTLRESRMQGYEEEGKKYMAEAERKSIKLIDDTIAWAKQEKAQLEARRAELEKRLD